VSEAERWDRYARDWHRVGPPLRPCPADVAVYEEAVRECSAPRALLLGVTPEIATMRWPAGTELIAIDGSAGMIQHVWPRKGGAWRAALRGDWLRLPLADGSCHVVIGDNPVHLPPFPGRHRAVLASVRRALAPDGILAMRWFCRPERAESLAQVFADLRAGRIGSFNAFKWRLAMALPYDPAEGLQWNAIWEAWNREVRDPAALLRDLGWPPEMLSTIEVNRGVTARVTFPTLREVEALVRESYEEVRSVVLDYELGERCPIVIARAR
jgi:SAM-dependent methyltransferase